MCVQGVKYDLNQSNTDVFPFVCFSCSGIVGPSCHDSAILLVAANTRSCSRYSGNTARCGVRHPLVAVVLEQ